MNLIKIFAACFFCMVTTALSAIPQPVEGTPVSMTGARITHGFQDTVFEFRLPEKWGLGEIAVQPDGTGQFLIFPEKRGYGVQGHVECFKTEELAQQAFQKQKNSYPKTKKMTDGFEVQLGNAYFACRRSGKQLIHTWYVLPELKKQHKRAWKALKNCMFVSNVKAPNPLPLTGQSPEGWWCHHPSTQAKILFKSSPGFTARANTSSYRSYTFELATTHSTAFMYVKWDQQDVKKPETHALYLAELMSDVVKADQRQKFINTPMTDSDQSATILPGWPYALVVVGFEDVVVGFAVKADLLEYPLNQEMVKYLKQLDYIKG